MQINKTDTTVVFIDPPNEVLSEEGLAWPVVASPYAALANPLVDRDAVAA